MTTDRDTTIAALLDRLDAPPAPAPDFWDSVREQLDHGGRRVVELRPLPHAGARTDRRISFRRRVVAALAAAAVIAVGVVLLTKGAGDDDGQRTVPATNPSTTGTTISPTASLIQSTAATWIDDVVHGNAEAAWELVGPQSRQMVDQTAFDGMLSDLRATWSPWAASGAPRQVLQLPAPDDAVWVVSMRLDATRDIQALVVRHTDTQVQVEPFLPGAALSLISLPFDATPQGDTPPSVPAGDQVQIRIEPDARSSLVAIDGTTIPPAELAKDSSGAIVGVPTSGSRGLHDVLVVEVTNDGTIAVADQLFTIVP